MKSSPLIMGKSRHSGCLAGWEQSTRIRLGWELLSRNMRSHQKRSSKQDEFAAPRTAPVIKSPSCATEHLGWFSQTNSGKREGRERSLAFFKGESWSCAADVFFFNSWICLLSFINITECNDIPHCLSLLSILSNIDDKLLKDYDKNRPTIQQIKINIVSNKWSYYVRELKPFFQ